MQFIFIILNEKNMHRSISFFIFWKLFFVKGVLSRQPVLLGVKIDYVRHLVTAVFESSMPDGTPTLYITKKTTLSTGDWLVLLLFCHVANLVAKHTHHDVEYWYLKFLTLEPSPSFDWTSLSGGDSELRLFGLSGESSIINLWTN